jgi:hypothetical protein
MTTEPGPDELDDQEGYDELTPEELLEQAQVNGQALFLATAHALSDSESALASWRESLAASYIRGWDLNQEWEPADILFALATNYVTFGGRLVEWDYASEVPFVTIENLPNLDLAVMLGIEPDRMLHLFRIGEDLARRLGGTLAWSRTDDGPVRLKVSGG